MLTIHRGERADVLVDALIGVVGEPLGDPFDPEVVAVHSRGVERWLTQRIASAAGASPGRADGVCANVEFPFPGRLIGDVLATATGVDRHEDPWRPERLVWPLLRVLDECIAEDWMALLAAHLGTADADGDDDLRKGRRFATARHLADLFDRYATFRPAMVRSWLAGDDGGLPADAHWQAALWRRLRTHLDALSLPERTGMACERLRAGTVDVDLPGRISLFGLTRLPPTYLEVLGALAAHRDVHLFTLQPSLTLWDRVVAEPLPPLPLPRRDDPTRGLPANPLLRAWGSDTREMQLVLRAAAGAEQSHVPLPASESSTLLRRIQADIRADLAPPGVPVGGSVDERMVLADDDRSLQVHSCHGRARQVEIARDAICHALADDPTIEPRDVIVLCTDIDEFAPLLHATFGAVAPVADEPVPNRGLPDLPYRLADRSLRQTNPLLSALDGLLSMIDGRITASDVLSFAGREPVRNRFHLDDDELERLRSWTASANIRWGLDATARAKYWLGDVDANTWRAGIDRLLLGVTMDIDGSRLVGGRLPLDDVESGDVDLAGRFAELVDRVATVVADCAAERSIEGWVTTLGAAVDLLMAAPPREAWQRSQVDGILREVLAEATVGEEAADSPLSLAEVRSLLDDRLRGRPSRADFRTGAVTMCTLVPMRAVPHRVVCILGLDDGAFPRTDGADGDDLLRRVPLVGDHDRRAEDRQLLLDAVLSATDRLIITTTGHDVRTNEPRPPAVPLSELIEVMHQTARGTERLVVQHPLQPFDRRSHLAGGDGAVDPAAPHPWAFDTVHLAGARALHDGQRSHGGFLAAPLHHETPRDGVVSLDELTRFLQHPVREFLRQRLGVNTWDGDEALDDDMPVELDALEQWQIGQQLVGRLLAGDPIDDAVEAELAAGGLPPGAMGRQAIESIRDTAMQIHARADALGVAGATASLEVDVDLGDVAVVGTVRGIGDGSIGAVSYGAISARHRLAAWVALVAVSAAHPDTRWESLTVGRMKRGARALRHGPIDGTRETMRGTAIDHLRVLVDLRRLGLSEPLPLPCKTGAAWAEAIRRKRDPSVAARREWESAYNFDREDVDGSHRRVWGRVLRLDELASFAPTESESGDGWTDDESRLGRLARRLWDPILAHESAP